MSVEYIFRPMMRDDIDGVMAVEEACFTLPWSRASLQAEVDDNELACYLVVQAGCTVIGYAGLWMVLDEAHITNVAVLAAYRRQGVGRQLMQALIAAARLRGAVAMTLEVRAGNTAAQRLYTALGFEARGLRKQYYSDNKEDALIMWLDKL